MPSNEAVLDVLGIGYGPANLATSVAIADLNAKGGKTSLSAAFIESYPTFLWHPGMMIDGSRMQISFLKDLATMRDPTSPYTFLSYLHEHGRLASFINVSTATPTRREFSDYLSWAARKVEQSGNGVAVHYGETVESIEPVLDDRGIELVRVHSRRRDDETTVTRLARNLVVSSGGSAHIPDVLKRLQRSSSADLIHTSEYLSRLDDLLSSLHASATASPATSTALKFPIPAHMRPPTPPSSSASSEVGESAGSISPDRARSMKKTRVAVIGSGQSAAEVFLNLRTHLPTEAEVDLIIRRGALRPSDDSGFSNETFDPAQTDLVYALGSKIEPEQANSGRIGLGGGASPPLVTSDESAEGARNRILAESKATNYSVVNPVTLQAVYEAMYDQRVEDDLQSEDRHPGPEPQPGARLRILPYREIDSASRPSASPHSGITLRLRHSLHNETTEEHYDAIVCATGYERQVGRHMVLRGLSNLFPGDNLEACEVHRNYRLDLPKANRETGQEVRVGVWLQGACESSHGISDSLLSVAGVRAGEIVEAIVKEGNLVRS